MTTQLSRRAFLAGTSSALAAAAWHGLAAGAPTTSNKPSPAGLTRKPAFADIDRALRAAVDDRTVAGVVAVGATREGIVYEGAFGGANRETGSSMSTDTVFWLLSMTKAITAAACMQLIEQGRLQLDQPAGEILPELKSPQILQGFDASGQPKLRPAKRAITVRHLLTHTSGYTYPIWSENIVRYQKATGMPDIAFSRNGSFAAPLEFEPGERWQYGISMDWVGKLIEAVTDQSLEIYFRENIFEPLEMRDSGFLIRSEQKRRVATMYNRQADGSLVAAPFEMNQRPEFFMGGGGLFSTPRDYMAFLQALLRGGEYRGTRILQPGTVAQMFKNQISDLKVVEMKTAEPAYSHSFDQFPGTDHKWGLSFDINTQTGPHGRSAGSASWAGLLNCYFWLDPVRQVTGALFTQLLPFYDRRVVNLFGKFEEGLYAGLA